MFWVSKNQNSMEKTGKNFHSCLGQGRGGWSPLAPYGQPDRKISFFYGFPNMSCIIHFQLRNKMGFNEVTVSSTSQDLGTCQQPTRLSHNTQATKKHSFSNSSQSLISHGSYLREDLIRRNLHSCLSSLIVLRYI